MEEWLFESEKNWLQKSNSKNATLIRIKLQSIDWFQYERQYWTEMGEISKRYNNGSTFSKLKQLKCTARIICSKYFIIHYPLLHEDVLGEAVSDYLWELTSTIVSKFLSIRSLKNYPPQIYKEILRNIIFLQHNFLWHWWYLWKLHLIGYGIYWSFFDY